MSNKLQKEKKIWRKKKNTVLKIYFPMGKILWTIDGINSSLWSPIEALYAYLEAKSTVDVNESYFSSAYNI